MSDFDPNDWEDVCFAMCMECPEDEDDSFCDPPADIVARYVRLYPHFEEDLIDFAATCRTEREIMRKYPPPELTQEQLDAGVKRAMAAFHRAMHNVKRREKRAAIRDRSKP